jgi:HK97 family phage major capsid protein
VVEAEDMPDVGANSLSIAFGKFDAGYLVADRSETRILRDRSAKSPLCISMQPKGSAVRSSIHRPSS